MQVGCDDRDTHSAFEAFPAMRAHPVQAMTFQRMDRRFHARILRLACRHQRNGHIHIEVMPLQLPTQDQDELMLIFQHRQGNPSSTGWTALLFMIQRVCGPNSENSCSLCGIVSPSTAHATSDPILQTHRAGVKPVPSRQLHRRHRTLRQSYQGLSQRVSPRRPVRSPHRVNHAATAFGRRHHNRARLTRWIALPNLAPPVLPLPPSRHPHAIRNRPKPPSAAPASHPTAGSRPSPLRTSQPDRPRCRQGAFPPPHDPPHAPNSIRLVDFAIRLRIRSWALVIR